MAYVWPIRLLTPVNQPFWMPTGQVVAGPPGMDGVEQVASTDGGGRWTVRLGPIPIGERDQIAAARAWSAYLQRGLRTCLVPMIDLGQASRPYAGGRPALPSKAPPAAAGDWFNWEPGFGYPMMIAHLVGAALLRATSVVIAVTQGGAMRAGQHFALNHAGKGWRLYRVIMVTATAGANQTCMIWPPLREATADAMAVELDAPRCLMRLQPDKADDAEPDLEWGQRGEISAVFSEAF